MNRKSVVNHSGGKDSPAEDDECNLINKDDFDEGKWKDIVTARATPIKANALARKNLSTARKLSNFQSPNPSFMNSLVEHNNHNSMNMQIINASNPA